MSDGKGRERVLVDVTRVTQRLPLVESAVVLRTATASEFRHAPFSPAVRAHVPGTYTPRAPRGRYCHRGARHAWQTLSERIAWRRGVVAAFAGLRNLLAAELSKPFFKLRRTLLGQFRPGALLLR